MKQAPYLAIIALLFVGSCSNDPSTPFTPGNGNPPPGPRVEWSWFNPSPQGNDLSAVWVTPDGDAFAVGTAGTILQRTGSTWEPMPVEPLITDFTGVWAASPDTIVATNPFGALFEFDGTRWTDWANSAVRLNDVFGMRATPEPGYVVYVVGAFGYIARRVRGQWEEVKKASADALEAVWMAAPNDVFAVGAGGFAGRFDADSDTWEIMTVGTQDYLDDIWGFSGDNVWVSGQGPLVYHYDGGGWTEMSLPVIGDVRGVWGTAPDSVYAVTSYGEIAYYDGGTWARVSQSTADLTGIRGDAGQAYIVGHAGRIVEQVGDVWQRVDQGPITEITDVWPVSDTEVYASTSAGEVVHFANGAHAIVSEAGCEFTRMWGLDASNLYVVGRCAPGGRWLGVIMKYDGVALIADAYLDVGVSSIWGNAADDIYAVSSSGSILHFDGNTWDLSGPMGGIHFDVWGSDSNDVWVVGADILLNDERHGFVRHFDGASWTKTMFPRADHLRGVWGRAPDDVYVVGDWSAIFHYDGQDWSEVDVPGRVQIFCVGGFVDGAAYVGSTGGFLFQIDDDTGHVVSTVTGTRLTIKSIRTGAGLAWATGANGAILTLQR